MRYIVCPVQNSPRVHSYHVDLFNLETPSFVRGLSNPQIGLRPYLEKLKIRVETRYNIYMCVCVFVYVCCILTFDRPIIRGSLNKFPDLWALLLIVHTLNSSSL